MCIYQILISYVLLKFWLAISTTILPPYRLKQTPHYQLQLLGTWMMPFPFIQLTIPKKDRLSCFLIQTYLRYFLVPRSLASGALPYLIIVSIFILLFSGMIYYLLYFILYLYLVKNKTFRLQKVNVNMHIHICTALHSFRFIFFCLIRTTSLKGGLDFDELYWLRDPSDQPEPKIEEVIIFLSPLQLLALFKGSQSYCLLKLFDMASFMLLGFTSSAWIGRLIDKKLLSWQRVCGGPIINCSGEVIGIGFYGSPFLPSNIISRWWKHYKSCRLVIYTISYIFKVFYFTLFSQRSSLRGQACITSSFQFVLFDQWILCFFYYPSYNMLSWLWY